MTDWLIRFPRRCCCNYGQDHEAWMSSHCCCPSAGPVDVFGSCRRTNVGRCFFFLPSFLLSVGVRFDARQSVRQAVFQGNEEILQMSLNERYRLLLLLPLFLSLRRLRSSAVVFVPTAGRRRLASWKQQSTATHDAIISDHSHDRFSTTIYEHDGNMVTTQLTAVLIFKKIHAERVLSPASTSTVSSGPCYSLL